MGYVGKDPKRCTKCRVFKPRAQFYKHGAAKGGVWSQCSECAAETARAKNSTVVGREALKTVNRKSKLKRAYGLTLADYQLLLDAQHGACAICLTTVPGGRGAFAVDHDHVAGHIRGLLCNKCNVGLGVFGDSSKLLLSAARYLELRRKP